VGTFAVRIAKSFGAEVTAVCSTGEMDTARSRTYVAVEGGLPQIFESLLLARFLPRIGRKRRGSLSPV
jgi:hypothetical protein